VSLDELFSGKKYGEHVYYICRELKGRIRDLKTYAICVDDEGEVLFLSVFSGREYYKPWFEVFNVIKPKYFYNTQFEADLLQLFYNNLPPGGRVFIEYVRDVETRTQLDRGYPIVSTRLGFLMFKTGFTWFKDWYFAEGFMEGNPKLQGEKHLSKEQYFRDLNYWYANLTSFINEIKVFDEISLNALKYAEMALRIIREKLERQADQV